MTIKFIVLDTSNLPNKPTATYFEYEDKLKEYLTDYGIKHKKVYTVKEMTGKFTCSMWSN